jgi:uncharacterized small protein (DUF1192 family)
MLSKNQTIAELKLLLEANARQLQVARTNRDQPRVLLNRIDSLNERIAKLKAELEQTEWEYESRDEAFDELLARRGELQSQLKLTEHAEKITRVKELRRQLSE